jgi:hypothetical protein
MVTYDIGVILFVAAMLYMVVVVGTRWVKSLFTRPPASPSAAPSRPDTSSVTRP